MMEVLVPIILFSPLLTFLVLYFGSQLFPRKGDWLACLMMGITFAASLLLPIQYWQQLPWELHLTWFSFPGLENTFEAGIHLYIDQTAALMLALVSGISFLVHLYSLEYMFEKLHYSRYFPYLGLFTSSMHLIVVSHHLLLTFVAWELVGFSSFLLIGFWYEKNASVKASRKALLLNKVGDIGFLIALLVLYAHFHTLDLTVLSSADVTTLPDWMMQLAGAGLLLGCLGKSAQFPFQLWLPEAMEGPTPASALIHAATMVAAGVYLLFRIDFLLSDELLMVLAAGGALTAFAGALPALVQQDIKKVLAYSTISQLGYMFMAVGTGNKNAALFHLFTHAFFKACLFLSAGAVIHEMHHLKRAMFLRGYFHNFDTLNMSLMGGLRKIMPLTFLAYLLASLALIGLPFFSGYLSKEAMIGGSIEWALHQHTVFMFVPALALATAGLTAFYMTRQLWLVFGGSFRLVRLYPETEKSISHVHDPSLLMLIPMLVLAMLSLFPVFSWHPFSTQHSWLLEVLQTLPDEHAWVAILVTGVSLGGVFLALGVRNRLSFLHAPKVLLEHWYLEKIWKSVAFVPAQITGKLFHILDTKAIDGGIHGASMGSVVLAHISHYADRWGVDGVVTGLSRFFTWIGRQMKAISQGQVQSYIRAIITLLLLLWAFYTWLW
ncbi:MAG: NADH-quinone oxidoreductase subunit L [Cytophagaceae bacterium]|jgi:NADH-quinone oxidoreductase subunit L|nr:NADH-quinone oxidoreductase subunit L [Cytophagaceae bacterium]